MTLREALLLYDSRVLEKWDHTAVLTAAVYNIGVCVSIIAGGKAKPKTADYFHPYRKRKREGLRITKENFNTLKQIFGVPGKEVWKQC